MRAYTITTGVIFALVTIAHLLRMASESRVLTEPVYILLTILTAALTGWAIYLLARSSR
jgi:hypothetical protein